MTLLNRLRKGRGWSMEALARRINTTASTINKLEKGQMRLTEDWLERLADAFDCTKAELLGESRADGDLVEQAVRHVLEAYASRGKLDLAQAPAAEIAEVCRHIVETLGGEDLDRQTREARLASLTGNIVDFATRRR
jgi:transcriptional regulator with XRE-family HTH domain